MWLSLYLIGVLVFVIGSVVALYHCVRYRKAWDQTQLFSILYIMVAAGLLALSVVLAASINIL